MSFSVVLIKNSPLREIEVCLLLKSIDKFRSEANQLARELVETGTVTLIDSLPLEYAEAYSIPLLKLGLSVVLIKEVRVTAKL